MGGRDLAAIALSAALIGCGEVQSSDPNRTEDSLAQSASSSATVAPTAIRASDCSATGTVANLPVDDNFLAVRTGPGSNYREQARLTAGVQMHLCTPAKDNRWIGIVYRPDGDLPDADRCRLTTDDSPRYEGPCRSGWVSARYVARGDARRPRTGGAVPADGEGKSYAIAMIQHSIMEPPRSNPNLPKYLWSKVATELMVAPLTPVDTDNLNDAQTAMYSAFCPPAKKFFEDGPYVSCYARSFKERIDAENELNRLIEFYKNEKPTTIQYFSDFTVRPFRVRSIRPNQL